MESETASAPQEASSNDELLFMQHSLLFADSFKDLKNLRKQLHSAAEYFETAYCKEEHQQLVVETLKDYVAKAAVSTVDHLGSVAYKVNTFLDDKVDEVSGAGLLLSSLEQRLRTYQEFIDRSGLSQQTMLMQTPKYHKQYTIPAVQVTIIEPRSSVTVRKGDSRSPTVEVSSSPGDFSFTSTKTNKELVAERGAVSPYRFSAERSGSVIGSSSPINPNSLNAKQQQYPPGHQRSVSMSMHAQKDVTEAVQKYSKKNRPLFKALFSMRKHSKDRSL